MVEQCARQPRARCLATPRRLGRDRIHGLATTIGEQHGNEIPCSAMPAVRVAEPTRLGPCTLGPRRVGRVGRVGRFVGIGDLVDASCLDQRICPSDFVGSLSRPRDCRLAMAAPRLVKPIRRAVGLTACRSAISVHERAEMPIRVAHQFVTMQKLPCGISNKVLAFDKLKKN